MIKELASSSAAAPKATETWAAAVAASAPTAANTAAKRIVGTTTLAPSLGASGAVYACVTMSALAFPEAQIAMAIPPSYPIDIQWGVGGLLCIDMIGALRGWRYVLSTAFDTSSLNQIASQVHGSLGPSRWCGLWCGVLVLWTKVVELSQRDLEYPAATKKLGQVRCLIFWLLIGRP